MKIDNRNIKKRRNVVIFIDDDETETEITGESKMLLKLRMSIVLRLNNQTISSGYKYIQKLKYKRELSYLQPKYKDDIEGDILAILEMSKSTVLVCKIRNFKSKYINSLFKEFILCSSPPPRMTLMMKAVEIAKAFFGQKVPDFEKRRQELINMVGDQLPVVDHQQLCNTIVAKDVIGHILTFLKFDSKLLFGFGSTCTNIYLSVLRCWPSLEIKSGSIYEQSSLVLRSVSTLYINENRVKFSSTEMKYLWSLLLVGNNLKTVKINDYKNTVVRSIFHFVNLKRNKNRTLFKFVTKVEFLGWSRKIFMKNQLFLKNYWTGDERMMKKQHIENLIICFPIVKFEQNKVIIIE